VAIKTAWIVMVPDADPAKHKAVIKTSKYETTMVLVTDCDQAVDICKGLVQREGVQVISLCPDFNNKDVARIAESVGEGTPINVCRADAPSLFAQYQLVKKEGWFEK